MLSSSFPQLVSQWVLYLSPPGQEPWGGLEGVWARRACRSPWGNQVVTRPLSLIFVSVTSHCPLVQGWGAWQTHYTCFVLMWVSPRVCSCALCNDGWVAGHRSACHFPGSWHDETWLAQFPSVNTWLPRLYHVPLTDTWLGWGNQLQRSFTTHLHWDLALCACNTIPRDQWEWKPPK